MYLFINECYYFIKPPGYSEHYGLNSVKRVTFMECRQNMLWIFD